MLPYADTAAMNAHLAEIARTVAPGAHAVLVLDGAGWHGGKRLVVPETITLLTLPPYAPELNPEELCNGAVKRALRNAVPASVAELYRQARRGFVRLGRQPALLHSFFRHTGLPVTRIT